jgi:lipopolysaccharide transport system permease protein
MTESHARSGVTATHVARGWPLPPLAEGEDPPLREPPPRSLRESLRELRGSGDLVKQMVRRDLATKHAGSFLGFFWSLLTPALTVAVYATVFSIMGFRPVGGQFSGVPFALFFFSGLVLWSVFNAGVSGGTGSIVGQSFLVRKIYFPRELLPLSVVLSALVTFCFEFVVLIAFATALGHHPEWTVILAIPIVGIMALIAFGAGLFLSAANVYFRDLEHLIGVILQLLFWSAPVLYDMSFIEEKTPSAADILQFNPLTPCLIAFRECVLLGKVPGPWRLLYAAGVGLALLLAGWIWFNRHERRLAELV